MITTDFLFGLTDELPMTGRVSGYAKIPFSSDTSAYGFIPVPLAVVGARDGPTVLLLAGSHGDEVDSQIALARLAQRLDPATLNGRVIIAPMANQPAARAGTRNSPIDGGNLNRTYPGDVRGSPTRVIADYIERHLMSVSDIVLDLHSDGRSIRYLPCATIIHHPDLDVRARRLAVALAFGAPSVLIFHSFEERNSSGAAKRAGAVRIATEIGGPTPVATTIAGVLSVLRWAGITHDAPADPPASSIVRVVRQDKDFIYALTDGVFEPAVALGDDVAPGDIAGFIHDPASPFTEPVTVGIAASGTVVCMRPPGLADRGDCLLHLASVPDAEQAAEVEAATAMAWLRDGHRRTGGGTTDVSSSRSATSASQKKPRSRRRER